MSQIVDCSRYTRCGTIFSQMTLPEQSSIKKGISMTLIHNIIGLLLSAALLSATTSVVANTTAAADATTSAKPKAGYSACLAIDEKARKIFSSTTYESDDGLREVHGEQFAADKDLNKPGIYDQGVPKKLILTCKWAKTEGEVKEYVKGIQDGAKSKNMNFVGVSWSPNDKPTDKK